MTLTSNHVPGLKFCSAHRAEILLQLYMLNFGPGRKRKFPQASLLRCENTVDAHAHVPFSARMKKMIAITWISPPV